MPKRLPFRNCSTCPDRGWQTHGPCTTTLPLPSPQQSADYRTQPPSQVPNAAATTNLCVLFGPPFQPLSIHLSGPSAPRCEDGVNAEKRLVKGEEKMDGRGWLQLGHWGLLPENSNQQRWLDQIKKALKGPCPKQVYYSKRLPPSSNPSKGGGVRPSGHLIL